MRPSSASAITENTTETDILELCIGQSAIVLVFQRHPVYDTILVMISFLETTKSQVAKSGEQKEWGIIFSRQKLLH
jgi:hypothetical protein